MRDYRTYYLANLAAKPNEPAESPPPGRWAFEYAFDQAYSAPQLDVQMVARLEERMRSDAALRQRYTSLFRRQRGARV